MVAVAIISQLSRFLLSTLKTPIQIPESENKNPITHANTQTLCDFISFLKNDWQSSEINPTITISKIEMALKWLSVTIKLATNTPAITHKHTSTGGLKLNNLLSLEFIILIIAKYFKLQNKNSKYKNVLHKNLTCVILFK